MVAEYVPQLYGLVGDWVVMEKLNGLELDEMEERIKTDKEFLSKYAQHAYNLIERTANAGITLNDVKFIDGHNVMVDPDTGEPKIVEQAALDPGSYKRPNEIMTDQLFGEIYQITHDFEKVDPSRVEFAFQLLRNAFQNNSPEDLYIKTRVIGPHHKNYRQQWFFDTWEELTDEAYQKILNSNRQPYLNYDGRGLTEAFTPEVITAVTQNDFDTFSQLIKSRKYKMDITDNTDSRYGSEVLPDDKP